MILSNKTEKQKCVYEKQNLLVHSAGFTQQKLQFVAEIMSVFMKTLISVLLSLFCRATGSLLHSSLPSIHCLTLSKTFGVWCMTTDVPV